MMTPEEFERMVAEVGFSPVPEKFRALVSNIALTVEDEPDEETKRAMSLGPDDTLLGLYQGIPHTARGEAYGLGGVLPDKIVIYRLPILEMAEQEGADPRRIVAETIWHEVAHHFGLDEGEVEKREREKGHLI